MFKGFFALLLATFLLMGMFVGQTIYKKDMESGNQTDIYNLTESIDTNFSCLNVYDNEYNITVPQMKISRFNKVVCAFAEFAVVSLTETMKGTVEFGYENPEYDYEFVISLFYIYIYVVIFAIIMPFIIPLIALLYLLFLGIKRIIKYFKKENETKR